MNLLPMFSQALKKFEASFSKVHSRVSLKYTTVCNIYIFTRTYIDTYIHICFPLNITNSMKPEAFMGIV